MEVDQCGLLTDGSEVPALSDGGDEEHRLAGEHHEQIDHCLVEEQHVLRSLQLLHSKWNGIKLASNWYETGMEIVLNWYGNSIKLV